jgi:IS1 family transposase
LSWGLIEERTPEALQTAVDDGPSPNQYFSDKFRVYEALVYYPAKHTFSEGKTDTYSVEADNTELRHYLACLARSSRCFSRRFEALKAAIQLFVYCFNRRQLHKLAFPNYQAHVYQLL